MRKLTRQDTICIGYYASKIAAQTMSPGREYPGLNKKDKTVQAPTDWEVFNGWLEGLELELVEEGDYATAKARLDVLIANVS